MTGLIPKKSEFKTHSQKKSLKTLFSATLSRNTALLHSCFLSAVQQLHSFSQHLKSSSQIQHSTQHSLYCAVLWGTRFHSGKLSEFLKNLIKLEISVKKLVE
jgi:hypothetical protein